MGACPCKDWEVLGAYLSCLLCDYGAAVAEVKGSPEQIGPKVLQFEVQRLRKDSRQLPECFRQESCRISTS